MSDIEDAPKVILGGKAWSIPMLAARQNRIIDPLILGLLPTFTELRVDKTAVSKLTEKDYDALLEIGYQALKKASPATSRDEYMDLPITLPELIGAFSTIAQQTGVFAKSAPGEAPAAASRPTGTVS